MQKSDLTPPAPKSYFAVAPSKLVLMSVLTLSLYNVYWMYKQWKAVFANDATRKGSPFWRAFFSIFWVRQLFRTMEIENAGPMAAGYILLGFASRLPGPAFLLGFANVLPLMSVQSDLNRQMQMTPAMKFSGKAIAVCILGALFMILVIIGLMNPVSN